MLALRTFAMALALTMALAPPAVAGTDDKKAHGPADALVERINEVRADHGLPALRPAPKLMRSAGAYARRLIRTDTFGHGSAFRRAGFRTMGEILAYHRNWGLRVGPPVRMWLDSPGHRSLMLSDSFSHVGAGPARGRFGSTLSTVWVVHFGANR